jgi:hypothetical protein
MSTQNSEHALSSFHWEADLLEFEMAGTDRQIACSISRAALQNANSGTHASRSQLQKVFNRMHQRITRLVWMKHGTAKPNSLAAIHISTEDLNEPGSASAT